MRVIILLIIILIILLALAYIKYKNMTVQEYFKIITNLNDHNEDDILVVSSHYNEDIEWLKQNDKNVVVCSKKDESPLCSQEFNKGSEASAYIKFLADNYDNLPKHIAFIHGHESGWHQLYEHNLMVLIFEKAKYKEYDYIPLNNYYFNDEHDMKHERINKVWDEFFRPYLNRDCPKRLTSDCCAQFIVSRNAIKKYPKSTYEDWYNKMKNYENKDDPEDTRGKEIAIIFEWLWHVIFGEQDEVSNEEYNSRFN